MTEGRRKSPQPRFRGRPVQTIDLPLEESTAIALRTGEGRMLMVMHDIDQFGSGFFRICLIGFDESGKPIMKDFSNAGETMAFFGEVSIVGPGNSDLWASMGYEDDDIRDEEGNITNKPREVRIFPKRDD